MQVPILKLEKNTVLIKSLSIIVNLKQYIHGTLLNHQKYA